MLSTSWFQNLVPFRILVGVRILVYPFLSGVWICLHTSKAFNRLELPGKVIRTRRSLDLFMLKPFKMSKMGPYLPYISHISPIYLPSISHISPIYLPIFASISSAWFGPISPIDLRERSSVAGDQTRQVCWPKDAPEDDMIDHRF